MTTRATDWGTVDFETWAASQPQDNYVYNMACGHEHDSAFRRTEGVFVQCSMHGRQRLVDGWFTGDPPPNHSHNANGDYTGGIR